MTSRIYAFAMACALAAPPLFATPFEFVRIGDLDGFGYSALPPAIHDGLTAASGAPADTNGNRLLEQTEFLPDLNMNGVVATGTGDDFDNRSSETSTCVGCTLGPGMDGEEFTDISLSTSFDNSAAANQVFDANTNSFGSGGSFPAGDPDVLSNQPGFIFDFFVASGDIVEGADLFLNLIFGDFDVVPAEVELTSPNFSGVRTIGLTTQGALEDGLIQAATANVAFFDVFAPVSGGFQGNLNVDFVAPVEPYTAFDFVELSVTEIPFEPTPVPEPEALSLLGVAFAALILRHRSRKS